MMRACSPLRRARKARRSSRGTCSSCRISSSARDAILSIRFVHWLCMFRRLNLFPSVNACRAALTESVHTISSTRRMHCMGNVDIHSSEVMSAHPFRHCRNSAWKVALRLASTEASQASRE